VAFDVRADEQDELRGVNIGPRFFRSWLAQAEMPLVARTVRCAAAGVAFR
jgi:hypothetical protein